MHARYHRDIEYPIVPKSQCSSELVDQCGNELVDQYSNELVDHYCSSELMDHYCSSELVGTIIVTVNWWTRVPRSR